MDISSNPNDYTNSSEVEGLWAIKAYEHAETYFDLISCIDCSEINFTRYDNLIYKKFRSDMKDLKVEVLDADAMKSESGKAMWRPFCETFKGLVDEYNFGSLLRIDATKGISDQNTILVPRIQFWAIEIARNREGVNKDVLEKKTNIEDGI